MEMEIEELINIVNEYAESEAEYSLYELADHLLWRIEKLAEKSISLEKLRSIEFVGVNGEDKDVFDGFILYLEGVYFNENFKDMSVTEFMESLTKENE
jgi:hypothetical protein